VNKTKTTSSKEIAGQELEFQAVNGKRVFIEFDEPEMTCQAGLLALAQFEEGMGLFNSLARRLSDRRSRPGHGVRDLLAQRVMQIAVGDGDSAGCSRLRGDAGVKLAAGKQGELASQPTMSRLENAVTDKDLLRMAYALGESFFDSFEGTAPKMVVIDMDPTAHLVYGAQQLSLFNTYVGDSCLMPFHAYDGVTGRLITVAMRPGKGPATREILALLKRIASRIRNRFPDTRLLFRADSHHGKPEVMDRMLENQVDWAVGQQPNNVLRSIFLPQIEQAHRDWELRREREENPKPARLHACAQNKAGSWKSPRRVVCRIEVGPLGSDVRYVSTSLLRASPRVIYEAVYCDRARAELMIKDHKMGLRSDRSPCRSAKANQFRLLLRSAAYVLLHRFRERALKGTSPAKACLLRVRIEFLKAAARIESKCTRVRVHLSERFPFKEVFVGLSKGEKEVLA